MIIYGWVQLNVYHHDNRFRRQQDQHTLTTCIYAGSYGYIAPGEHKCFCYSKTTVHFSNVRLRKLSLTSLFCQKVIKNFSAFILLRHSFSLSFGTLKTVCMSLRHSFFYLFISK